MRKICESLLGTDWQSDIQVGRSPNDGGVGISNCKFTYFHGQVIRIHHTDTAITHTSGGGGEIRTHGNGFVTGSIDPIRSHTEIKTDFKMWVRDGNGKDFCYKSSVSLEDVADGQYLTLILLEDVMVAYVNHNIDDWQYVAGEEQLARISNQNNVEITNADYIKWVENYPTKGGLMASVAALMILITHSFVVRSDFWGMGWIESPSNPNWYLGPIIFLLLGIMAWGRSEHYWMNFFFHFSIAVISSLNGLERWGIIISYLIIHLRCLKPREIYKEHIDSEAIAVIRGVIGSNASLLINNWKKFAKIHSTESGYDPEVTKQLILNKMKKNNIPLVMTSFISTKPDQGN